MLITKTAGNALFFEVSVLLLEIMNPLRVSLCVHMDAIIKTRAFVQLRVDGESCKTEQWYYYLRKDTKMPPTML